jgi:hypothetical protein
MILQSWRAEVLATLQVAMLHLIDTAQGPADCPLSLAERLIALAADAGDAGFPVAAEHLIHLADQILDRPVELRI